MMSERKQRNQHTKYGLLIIDRAGAHRFFFWKSPFLDQGLRAKSQRLAPRSGTRPRDRRNIVPHLVQPLFAVWALTRLYLVTSHPLSSLSVTLQTYPSLMANPNSELSHSQYAIHRKELLLLVKQLRSIGCSTFSRHCSSKG